MSRDWLSANQGPALPENVVSARHSDGPTWRAIVNQLREGISEIHCELVYLFRSALVH